MKFLNLQERVNLKYSAQLPGCNYFFPLLLSCSFWFLQADVHDLSQGCAVHGHEQLGMKGPFPPNKPEWYKAFNRTRSFS